MTEPEEPDRVPAAAERMMAFSASDPDCESVVDLVQRISRMNLGPGVVYIQGVPPGRRFQGYLIVNIAQVTWMIA